MAREIVLVRHATTADTRAGLFSGHGPTPLDSPGRAQADALRERVGRASYDAVLVSPVARARETAERAGLLATELFEPLVEWRYGELVGITSADVRRQDPDWALWTHGAPGGETPDEVVARVDAVLARLEALEGTVVLVSHGHLLRALIVTWLGLPMASAGDFVIDPASVSVLGNRNGRPALVLLNDRGHIPIEAV